MAITLVTGVPGSGKTAWVVDHIIDLEGKRPIVVDGIPELSLDADPAPPIKDWTETVADDSSQSGEKLQFSFPVGSLVVIDECQRVFPRRAPGAKVPAYIAAFETHRHRGLDFLLITQHPRLLDSHVRSLVGRHIHIRQTWQGRHKYEWSEVGDPESKASRDVAARDRYVLPKRVFTRYKSAEVHTKTRHKIPLYAWILVFSLVGLTAIVWNIWNSLGGRIKPIDKPGLNVPAGTSVQSPSHSGGQVKVSLSEYVAAREPRVPGLYHTAPVYDEVTTPKDAPIPVGCISTKKACRCIDQQGNNYLTSQQVCESFVSNGLFIPWRDVKAEKAEKIDKSERRTEVKTAEGPRGSLIPWSGPPGPGAQLSPSAQPGASQSIQEPVPVPVPQSSPWRFNQPGQG